MADNNVPPAGASYVSPPTPGIAIASLIFGILGFITMGLAGIVAVVLGHISLSRINHARGALGGRGISIGGLITGYLSSLLLLVWIILGGAIFAMKGVAATARSKRSEADFSSFQSALEMYKLNAGTYPTGEQGLVALIEKPTVTPLPKRWIKIMNDLPLYAWGNSYSYKFPGSKNPDKPEITTKGPDGIEFTGDDLSSQDH